MASSAGKQKRAVVWSIVERFSSQIISLVVSIVIARLLIPQDYGVVAMVTIFIAISEELIYGGFTNALIQKGDRTELDFSTVFYFNIGMGCFLYGLLYALSPLIARFYDEPELVNATRLLGLAVVFRSLSIVQDARLSIDLDFKRRAKITLVSSLSTGCIGIIMAYRGHGCYALIWQQVLSNLFISIALWSTRPWKPMLAFSMQSFKTLFNFGSKLIAARLLDKLYSNIYSLIIGKVYNAASLGLFSKASNFLRLPSRQVTTVVDNVAYPVMCEVQNDYDELKFTFEKFLKLSLFVIAPILAILCVFAKPIVLVLLGKKWLGLVPFLQILSFAFLFEPIQNFNNQILNVIGRSDLTLKSQVIRKIIGILILIATIHFDVIIVAIGLVVYYLLDSIVVISFVKKYVGIESFGEECAIIFPYLFAVVVAGAIGYLFTLLSMSPFLQLICGGVSFAICYLTMCHILKCKELSYIKLRK